MCWVIAGGVEAGDMGNRHAIHFWTDRSPMGCWTQHHRLPR